MKSIGCEVCENDDGDLAKAEDNAAELIANLMQQYGIPIDNVVPHQHWSGKYCPDKILPHWGEFIAKVQASYDRLISPPVPPTLPKGKKKPMEQWLKDVVIKSINELAAKGKIGDPQLWINKVNNDEDIAPLAVILLNRL
jgi:N-acetylmuramoyl-L-alanine amidase